MKAILILSGFVLLFGIIAFFYPKPSSSYPTEFSIQLEMGAGVTERDARMHARWKETRCRCLGLEKPNISTSYTTNYVCYGLVMECVKTK